MIATLAAAAAPGIVFTVTRGRHGLRRSGEPVRILGVFCARGGPGPEPPG